MRSSLIFLIVVVVSLAAAFSLRGYATPTKGLTTSSTTSTVAQQSGPQLNVTNMTLNSTGLAPYAYLISTPILNSSAKYATAGFNIAERMLVNGSMSINIASLSSAALNSTYIILPSERLYYIDTSLGDDAPPNGEYSLGDDGVVLTDSNGYIIKG